MERSKARASQRVFNNILNNRQSIFSNSYLKPTSASNTQLKNNENSYDQNIPRKIDSFFQLNINSDKERSTNYTQPNDRRSSLIFFNEMGRERLFSQTQPQPKENRERALNYNDSSRKNGFSTNNSFQGNNTSLEKKNLAGSVNPEQSIFAFSRRGMDRSNTEPITPQKNLITPLANPPGIMKTPGTGSRSKNVSFALDIDYEVSENKKKIPKKLIPESVYDNTDIPNVIDFSISQPISQATPIDRHDKQPVFHFTNNLNFNGRNDESVYSRRKSSNSKIGHNSSYNPYMRRVNQRLKYSRHNYHMQPNLQYLKNSYNNQDSYDNQDSLISDHTEASKFMQSLLPTGFPGKLPKEYKYPPKPLEYPNKPSELGPITPDETPKSTLKSLEDVFPKMPKAKSEEGNRYKLLMELNDSNLTKAKEPNLIKSQPVNTTTSDLIASKKNHHGLFYGSFGAGDKSNSTESNPDSNKSHMVNREIQTDLEIDKKEAKLTRKLLEMQSELVQTRKKLSSAIASSSSAPSKISKDQAIQIEEAMNKKYREQKEQFQNKQKRLQEEHNDQMQELKIVLSTTESKNVELEKEVKKLNQQLQEINNNYKTVHEYAYKRDQEYEDIKRKCGKAIKAYTHFINLYLSGSLPKPKFVSLEDATKYRNNKSIYAARMGDRVVVDEKEFKKIVSNLKDLSNDVDLYADEQSRRLEDRKYFKSAVVELEKDYERERKDYENEIAKINYTLDDERELQRKEHAIIVRQLNRKLEQSKEMHEKEIMNLKDQMEEKFQQFRLIDKSDNSKSRGVQDTHNSKIHPVTFGSQGDFVFGNYGEIDPRTQKSTAKAFALDLKSDHEVSELKSLSSIALFKNQPNQKPMVSSSENYNKLDIFASKAFTDSQPVVSTETKDEKANHLQFLKEKIDKKPINNFRLFGNVAQTERHIDQDLETITFPTATSTTTASEMTKTNHDSFSNLKRDKPKPQMLKLSSLVDATRIDHILDQLNQSLVLLRLDTSFSSSGRAVDEIKQQSHDIHDHIFRLRRLIFKVPGISTNLNAFTNEFEDVKYLLDEIPQLKTQVLNFERQLDGSSTKGLSEKVYAQILWHLNSVSSKLENIHDTAVSKSR